MGVINHDAVVATTCDNEEVDRVLLWIHSQDEDTQRLFGKSEVMLNGYQTIVMFPDGSKEGWSTSSECDQKREEFLSLLEDFGCWNICHVSFGEFGSAIKRTNCEKWR